MISYLKQNKRKIFSKKSFIFSHKLKNGEIKIKKAYNSFYEEFKDFDEKELKIIRDKVLNLEVIFVSVKDEVDAFTIFETLNAKGKDLTPMDLIKNPLYWREVASAELAVVTDDSYSEFFI